MQHKYTRSAMNNSRPPSSSHGWICESLQKSASRLRASSGPWQREQSRAGPGLARSLSVYFLPRRRCSSPVQYAIANMADITNSCSSPLAPSGPTPSITQTAIPTQFRTRARSRDPWKEVCRRKRGEGYSEGGGKKMLGCWWRDVNFPGSGCSPSAIRQTEADA